MMNERLKELIEQCTDRHFNEGGGFETFDKEKFALAIVRECVEVCRAHAMWDIPYTPSKRFAKAIEKHFGVE
jgi:hypothetical protein